MFDEMYLSRIKDDSRAYCKICNIVKKERCKIEHCFDCNLCVEGMPFISSTTIIAHGWVSALQRRTWLHFIFS